MIVFFAARKIAVSRALSQRQKELATADLAMFKRVNADSRLDTPTTKWTYDWYNHELSTRASAHCRASLLAEFITNACFVRNTASLAVRIALRDKSLPWLTLHAVDPQTEANCVSNLRDLDLFFIKSRCQIFGTYVNPMRTRAKDPVSGYLLLVRDLAAVAEQARTIADASLKKYSVRSLLESVRGISGYGGSGFRAKELVNDVVDNLVLGGFVNEGSLVRDSIRAEWMNVTVIGIGPCRTVNYMFGYFFNMYEDMAANSKWDLYVELLEYTAAYIRSNYLEYADWSNLAIFICYVNARSSLLRGT